MEFIDQAGAFRGAIVAQDIYEAKSGAVAISNTFEATEMWDKASESWRTIPSHTTRGRTYIIGKHGAIIPTGVEQMVAIGWDKSIVGVKATPYINRPCSFTVERSKNPKYFEAGWVSPFDEEPGGGSAGEKFPASESRAEALDRQFGSQLRAFEGPAETVTITDDDVGELPAELLDAPEPNATSDKEGFDEVPF